MITIVEYIDYWAIGFEGERRYFIPKNSGRNIVFPEDRVLETIKNSLVSELIARRNDSNDTRYANGRDQVDEIHYYYKRKREIEETIKKRKVNKTLQDDYLNGN